MAQNRTIKNKTLVKPDDQKPEKKRVRSTAIQRAVKEALSGYAAVPVWDKPSQIATIHTAMQRLMAESIKAGLPISLSEGKESQNTSNGYYEFACQMTVAGKSYNAVLQSAGTFSQPPDLSVMTIYNDDRHWHVYANADIIGKPEDNESKPRWGKYAEWVIEDCEEGSRTDFVVWLAMHHPDYVVPKQYVIVRGGYKPFSAGPTGALQRPEGLARGNWATKSKPKPIG